MSVERKPIAFIPARGGSKRVPGKNIVDLEGQPLISYPIETCLKSDLFSEVVVSTDSPEIASVAKSFGANVDNRPEQLAGDKVSAVSVVDEFLSRQNRLPTHFCLVYPMAVFILTSDLRLSVEHLTGANGVMGVSPYSSHPFKAMVEKEGFLEPIWPDLNLQQSQNFPETVVCNGTFFWMNTMAFIRDKTFYPSKLKSFIIPLDRAIDIDTYDDLERARQLMALKKINNK